MTDNQTNQIKEVKKSIDICYHCREKEQIILLYTHTFYKRLNNPTMVTEALKFCWKCVPLLDENYYLNYGYTISENLLAKAQESWGSLIDAKSKKIMTFKVELKTAEEKMKEMGEKVGKIILEIGKNIPLKCSTCSFNSDILVAKRQKCQNILDVSLLTLKQTKQSFVKNTKN